MDAFLLGYGILNMVALLISFMIIEQFGPVPNLRDSSLFLLILRIVLFPAFFVIGFFTNYGKDIATFLSTKPFKKANFEIGETVLYCGREFIVLKNEKLMEGDSLLLLDDKETHSWNREITADASKVRRVSKLEIALK